MEHMDQDMLGVGSTTMQTSGPGSTQHGIAPGCTELTGPCGHCVKSPQERNRKQLPELQ